MASSAQFTRGIAVLDKNLSMMSMNKIGGDVLHDVLEPLRSAHKASWRIPLL